jgi:hypothetical protein
VRKWVLFAATLIVAVLNGTPAHSAAVDVQFVDVCGGVRVTIDAPDGTTVKVTKGAVGQHGGVPVGSVQLSGGSVTIGAWRAEEIGITVGDAPEVKHVYNDPRGCVNPARVTTGFSVHCPNDATLSIHSMTTSPAAGTFVVTVNDESGEPFEAGQTSTHRHVSGAPDGSVLGIYQILDGGTRAFHAAYTLPLSALDTPTGCGPGSLKATFTNLCVGMMRIDFTNTATADQTVDILRNGSLYRQVILPASASNRSVPGLSAQDVIDVRIGGQSFGTHTYTVHAACRKPFGIDVSFTDTCAGTTVSIASFTVTKLFLIRTSDGTRVELLVPLGSTKSADVTGATIEVIVERHEGPPYSHSYARPSGCDASDGSGLPVTGTGTLRLALGGVMAVLLGAAVFVLLRRRVPG